MKVSKDGFSGSNIATISSDDDRSFLELHFAVSKHGGSLAKIFFMRDKMIPGYEFEICFLFFKIRFRRNFPESDAVFAKWDRDIEEMSEGTEAEKEIEISGG